MASYELFAIVLSYVSQFKPFQKFSKSSKETFAYDITLVALSVRTGYLVDSLHVSDHLAQQIYSILLKELCKLSGYFNDVMHLHEHSTNQSFIVNKSLLFSKLGALIHDTSGSYPAFVHIPERGEPSHSKKVPPPLRDILQTISGELMNATNPAITEEVQTSIQLPQNLPPSACIPLAAIILDYPVAYMPSSDFQTSVLGGVPLVLYQCRINFIGELRGGKPTRGREHLLLRFSCPASLADNPSANTNIKHVLGYLESTFGPRIRQFLPNHCTFRVDHERITLNCVAL